MTVEQRKTEGTKLQVRQEITERQIEQLLRLSQTDPEVIRWTSDPKRFKDRQTFNKWRKTRNIYVLENTAGDLQGIVWFGKKPFPESTNLMERLNPQEYPTTFAIRIYGEARGKGLAQTFMVEAFTLYKGNNRNLWHGVWLETHMDNTPALALYERFGFKIIAYPDKRSRILMVI